jgi:hypothetical protein
MKRLLLGMFALAALTIVLSPLAPVVGQDRTRQGKDDTKGWVQLFDGKTLKGWKTPETEPGKWSVENGAIVGRGKDRSHLFSERGDYENFHYRIEAKISDKGNSGQYFRAKFGPGWPSGYEAQINSTHPDPQKTGSLYGFVKVTKMLVPPDTWFKQEVIANGNHIIIKVNGEKVVDFIDQKNTHTRGHFAIQQHPPGPGAEESIVQVRKVEVKELPPTK